MNQHTRAEQNPFIVVRVYDGAELRHGMIRTAAVVVICVLASLPTLARLHDRLSVRDDVSRFRLSKNLERPHEKNVTRSLEPVPVRFLTPDDSIGRTVTDVATPLLTLILVSSLEPRAPPIR